MDERVKGHILEALRGAGDASAVQSVAPADKGGVSDTACVKTREAKYFVKWNSSPQFGLFRAEALDLTSIAATKTIRVPTLIAWADSTEESPGYMIQEWIAMGTPEQQEARLGADLGEKLAAMHLESSKNPPPGYGQHDHYGRIPSKTVWHGDWATYFQDRMREQMADKIKAGLLAGERLRRYETLIERVPSMLGGIDHRPSLLHGDLHIGNVRSAANGEPVVYDPWAWYGNHEWEVASAKPWGYFPPAFFEAYQATFPMADGYKERLDLYMLNSLLWSYLHDADSARQVDEVLQRYVY